MPRSRDPVLSALVGAAIASYPRITATGLEAYLRARGRPLTVRRCAVLLARDRPAGKPPDPAAQLEGVRLWIPGPVLAAIRAAALPGESDIETIARLARGGPVFGG
jgi:hypothetical protein